MVGLAMLALLPLAIGCSSSKDTGFADAGTLDPRVAALNPADLRQSAFRFGVALNSGDYKTVKDLVASRCIVAATTDEAVAAQFGSARDDFAIPPDLTVEDLGDHGTSRYTGPDGSAVVWQWAKEDGSWRNDSCS